MVYTTVKDKSLAGLKFGKFGELCYFHQTLFANQLQNHFSSYLYICTHNSDEFSKLSSAKVKTDLLVDLPTDLLSCRFAKFLIPPIFVIYSITQYIYNYIKHISVHALLLVNTYQLLYVRAINGEVTTTMKTKIMLSKYSTNDDSQQTSIFNFKKSS